MKSIKFQRRAPIPPQRHPGGRPSSYREEYVNQVRKLCMLGATDEQIANVFEVDSSTIARWKSKPEFHNAMKEGKMIADSEVANSLYRRACGYSHQSVKIHMNEGVPVYVPYVEHYPPDTAAAFIWLKNRQPHLWRDQRKVELTGEDGGPIKIQKIESRVIDADFIDITDDVISEDHPQESDGRDLVVVKTSIR
jgi:hypothetical protein